MRLLLGPQPPGAPEALNERNSARRAHQRQGLQEARRGARALCGVQADGKVVDEASFAEDMRGLAEGIDVELPLEEGGSRTIWLQVFVLGLSADFPAAGALLPFYDSMYDSGFEAAGSPCLHPAAFAVTLITAFPATASPSPSTSISATAFTILSVVITHSTRGRITTCSV